ncbi:hypothetical protein C2G38_1162401 [Gigaspora rosea]|uniref:Uncharacterized protein n=1 Tax=Gigaspora rosea TaxID=44941 RepID=A0A397W7Y2_9GLOM|nr:hypothetical protein C2G38_1162401 [Gigaspora rosea]
MFILFYLSRKFILHWITRIIFTEFLIRLSNPKSITIIVYWSNVNSCFYFTFFSLNKQNLYFFFF